MVEFICVQTIGVGVVRTLDADGSSAEVLARVGRFGDTIETQYGSYWDQIADRSALRALFGLLSRMRGAIDLKWVRTWADAEAVDALQRTAQHYFRREADRWHFFHNSFREYLRNRTQEAVPGKPSPEVDRQLYRTLADHCAATPADSPNSWDALYYRCLAHDHEEAVRLATPGYFRDQFLAFRPLDAIREDIDAALSASAEIRDAVALVRILLAGAEFQQRDFHLDDTSLGLLLLAHGKREQAMAHVTDGNRLRESAGSALEFARELLALGSPEEARRVFDLAEPLRFLCGATALDDLTVREDAHDLYTWAEVAPFFLEMDDVLEAIDRVRAEAVSRWNMTAAEATRLVRRRMRLHLGYGVVDKQDWNALDKVLEGFDLQEAIDLEHWRWLVTRVLMDRARVGKVAKARHYLGRILEVVDPATLDEEERVLVAEWVFRILGDVEEAQRWLAGLDQPEIQADISSQSKFESFKLRFRLNRLLYALGNDAQVASLVPDSDDPKLDLAVLFERSVCKIARIWGRYWRGDVMTSSEIRNESWPLLRFLNRDSCGQAERPQAWISYGLRKDLFTLLIRAVACHGPDAVTALRDLMEREWDEPSREAFWSPDLIRELVLVLYSHGIEVAWAAQRLRAIEPSMLSGADISGRVEQFRAQAEAWQQLDRQEDVDRCLNRMLQASLGVGYRKDYQLDSWIHWLGCINEDEPASAADRIGWFASAIQALSERAEGPAAASASRDLLRVAFRWSPRRAVHLFSWLAKQGLIRYPDGFRDLLIAALETDPAPTQIILPIYNHLHQTISLEAASDIAALIVHKTAAQAGGHGLARAVHDMLASMERYGLSSTRSHMRHEIATALQNADVALGTCGLSDADLIVSDVDPPYGSKLKLDDVEMTTREVLERVNCIDDIEALLRREDRPSYFDWAPFVREFAASLSCPDLVRLAALFSDGRRHVEVLCAIGDQMHAIGSTDLAWKVGRRAMDNSAASGWDPLYDGGSRTKAFETLVRIRPEVGRELAYRSLVQDVVEGSLYPAGIVLHLDRILPLVTSRVPLSEIWTEVENHVHALFADVQSTPDIVALLTTVPENDTAESAVADLIMFHLDHPATVIAQAAQRTLGACVHDHIGAVGRIVVESLEGAEPRQESVLMVLDALSLTDTSQVSRFSDRIQLLTASPNLCVRQAAERICSRLEVTASPSQPQTRALAPVYELALPTHPSFYTPSVQQASSHRPMPDSDVPHEMLRPFNQNLETIAKFVGLDPENLYWRAAQIMLELEPRESWYSQAELRLRSMMNSTGLALTFRRPRAVVARRAMFHLVAELADAGRLDRGQLVRLDFVLRTYDPAMVLLEPARRPAAIGPMSVSDDYRVGRPEWIEAVADAFESSALEHSDGRIVIAEETSLKRLETSHLTERRQFLVCDAEAKREELSEEGDGFFHEVKQQWTSEYHSLGAGGSQKPIVIRHVGIGYDSPADSWLALNPAVGEQLGWTPSEAGLFAWVDDNGDVMVESLWWVDGVLAQWQTTASREEVGEGWLVLASQDAFRKLRTIFPSMTRRQHVERHYCGDARTAQTKSSIRETSL